MNFDRLNYIIFLVAIRNSNILATKTSLCHSLFKFLDLKTIVSLSGTVTFAWVPENADGRTGPDEIGPKWHLLRPSYRLRHLPKTPKKVILKIFRSTKQTRSLETLWMKWLLGNSYFDVFKELIFTLLGTFVLNITFG